MVVVEGTVEEIIYANESSGYTVCDIRCTDKTVTAVGHMPFLNEGESVRLTGKWTTHPEYGEQLKVELYEKTLPQTAESIEKYLSSGIVKGIGPVTAKKIVERFGEETFEIIQSYPERLVEIKGISIDKAYAVSQVFYEQRDLRQVMMFLQKYNIGSSFAVKIFKYFGSNTLEEIKANPYKLADEKIGIGFRTADSIAMSLGIDSASEFRIKSGIKYILSQAASEGHTYLPEEKLKECAARLLGNPDSSIENALVSLRMEQQISIEQVGGENRIYLPAFYHAELEVCKRITQLCAASIYSNVENIEDIIRRVEEEENIRFEKYQSEAIELAFKNNILVITGGPGTGKTTIIKGIMRILEDNGVTYALAAPTGRAAKRMSEATGREAKTIHRLLEVAYSADETEQVFMRNENNPIDAEMVIIDEMSMVDILLMNSLLKAVAMGTRLVLVGDSNQLPPVRAGNVLRDIINSGRVKTVCLTEIFRQVRESMIIVNAHLINSGNMPHVNVKDKDFYLVKKNSNPDILNTVIDLCASRLPKSYGYDFMKHIQVISPVKKGDVGVYNLNIELQKVFNPKEKSKKEKAHGGYIFRQGDKIMQIKNNYNMRWGNPGESEKEGIGVFNGDMGIITAIDDEEQKLTVLFDGEKEADYDFPSMDEIEPAYAVTVHKSQGSEFPVVVMPVFLGPPLLMTRNLIYTAITRARELVVLVGSEHALSRMVANDREMLRYSGLMDKLSLVTV